MPGDAAPERTIHDVAEGIRRRGAMGLGEREWAALCVAFAAHYTGTPTEQQDAVLHTLATTADNQARQLALVWLDGAGYGAFTLAQLAAEVLRLRHVS